MIITNVVHVFKVQPQRICVGGLVSTVFALEGVLVRVLGDHVVVVAVAEHEPLAADLARDRAVQFALLEETLALLTARRLQIQSIRFFFLIWERLDFGSDPLLGLRTLAASLEVEWEVHLPVRIAGKLHFFFAVGAGGGEGGI